MRHTVSPASLVCALALLLLPGSGAAQVQVERVASGLDRPVFLTAPPGDPARAFLIEQKTGAIRILDLATRTLRTTPFLVIGGLATGGNEQGLLGLAFDPDYASNGFFYVYVTVPGGAFGNGRTEIRRYTVSADPNVANASSLFPVLSYDQPFRNHNAGWMGFGPDDMLYIASGDGGNGNDPANRAQDITNQLLGKILRIDPSGDDFPGDPDRNYAIPAGNPFVGVTGDDEIWSYGLRNPWRASFDRLTGDFYIGDVGQGACEEIDVEPFASTGGVNYGWRLREGVIATPGVGGPAPPGAIDPIFDYPHDAGNEACSGPGAGFEGISVTGGYVYRGPIAALQGRYYFADFGTASLWSLVWDGSAPSGFDGTNYTDLMDHSSDPAYTPDVGSIGTVSSFGEDDAGNLYVLDLDGEVFLLPEPGAGALPSGVAMLGALARRRRADRRRRGSTPTS